MRICIPTIDDRRQLSEVCDHFGSAPYFTIYDFETNAYETVNNSGHDHEHGTCHPMDNLKDKNIGVVICKGLGRRALEKLNDSRIKVFRIDRSMVKDIIEDVSDGKLEEINPESTCRHQGCH
jgi:predicted Fe-Mo cluster-binding NifX family protein